MSMDIYARAGTKVTFTGNGGYDSDKKHANEHLSAGEQYTIKRTIVGGWRTDVVLVEVPEKAFNSVHFD